MNITKLEMTWGHKANQEVITVIVTVETEARSRMDYSGEIANELAFAANIALRLKDVESEYVMLHSRVIAEGSHV